MLEVLPVSYHGVFLSLLLWPRPLALRLGVAMPFKWSEATKDELYEIAGAFAKLETDPRSPGAAAVYEEVETTLGNAIKKWESGAITAPAILEEKARLRLGRARVRIALNDMMDGTLPEKVAGAIEDYGVGIGIMEDDLRQNPDKLMYSEYPDALVKRGLAQEQLKNWEGAAKDYTRAIDALRPKDGRPDKALKGDAILQEGDGLGMNPLILNFRGNVLSQLGRYEEAVEDYREATQIFSNDGEARLASFSRANEALALFGAGRDREAEKVMQIVVRNDPGVTDAHVALAASYWSQRKIAEAESQWKFACENIDSGCQSYKDLKWVAESRRWPPSLVASLKNFLQAKTS
ncbi:unnamed protein product [Symbiodinium natans]|uniref:Tetratricopeptide repeat protein n=1 Tax=Symbiodinium natans TaxID=878477 RepID=A0A812SYR0_9DINO|nr:unnamed protein product [Symbiodinium natans]